MTLRKIFSLLASLTLMAAGPAFAADANLNFTGLIMQPSCSIDSASANQVVNLGSAPIMNFASVGSTTNATPFNVKLVSCAPGTVITMTVAGTMDTVASVLQNTGTATQVGVQLLKASSVGATTGTPVTLNSAVAMGTVDSTYSMTIPFVAQFYELGTLTPGSVVATATVNFTYN
ncbi:fimbrial protein [Paraburkholderia sabiae]|uniref:Fimbrial protein n=1 Tax=Paraburkholderia sabiae TaxID=273251 RepID=A0ABU9QN83_9BURK|nr:fimbrial protein [Paraburkholderia sabiae]WJZ74889.1 fimbrial protein [Paraburkholderia sabiae]CAD6551216.1 Fimbrial subunit type 1 [Paraburkholderia sabiae]